MSEANVEVVREAMALIRRTGTGKPEPRLYELLSPDMTLDMSRRTFNPDVYEGYEGLRRFKRERDEVWEEFLVTPERMIDAGESVVVFESLRGRGKGGGVETRSRSASVWTVRDGQVVHMATYQDPQDALKAAGLAGIWTVRNGQVIRMETDIEPKDALEAVGLAEYAMSANLDLVHSIYAAWERGDWTSAEWAHPDIEFVLPDGPVTGTWRGLAAMAAGWRDFLSAWDEYRLEAEEYTELNDGCVLVLVDLFGRGKTSGLELGQTRAKGANVFHLRGGKVTRLVGYNDRERALADLGRAPEGRPPDS